MSEFMSILMDLKVSFVLPTLETIESWIIVATHPPRWKQSESFFYHRRVYVFYWRAFSFPIENTNSPMKMKTFRQFPSERSCCYFYPWLETITNCKHYNWIFLSWIQIKLALLIKNSIVIINNYLSIIKRNSNK